MNLTLKRDARSDGVTLGELYVNGVFLSYSLEPDDEGAHPAIPEGRYRVVVNYSTRFKRNLPFVVDVPGRFGIRFHPGNAVRDTEGCILLGTERDETHVWQSRDAVGTFQATIEHALAKGEQVWLTVTRKTEEKRA